MMGSKYALVCACSVQCARSENALIMCDTFSLRETDISPPCASFVVMQRNVGMDICTCRWRMYVGK